MHSSNRLQSRYDFRAVFREGIRCHGSHLTLRALHKKAKPIVNNSKVEPENFELEVATKIGISISTKVSKRAVVRNRIKRQIRAAFRSLLPQISPGWLLVVIVKPSVVQAKCDYDQFLQELEQLLTEAEVIDGHS
ncbi:ribonuclease P protein component [Gloeocapsopsis crepidinum LEGE 06123]|uniref:Ribonuclease P protein component n=1 Tax=Gloeocapsopsis crepidinum LEGE 06123 TaxID=588587 RepID=A0ABR9UNL3_9CHRO|nr:ribonuclease P protein component [Gloeocapsopsis crepidinum]MBE9189854.1 ribonuclease P protein component [Gloeocapsopsis crepidinum LEGE 06123]